MPKIILPVPETESSVTRPVVLEVTRRLMELTNISKDSVQIYYPSDIGGIAQPGSTLSSQNNANNILLQNDERIAIEVSEEYDEAYFSSTAIRRPENRLIFLDDDLEVLLRPIYVKTAMTLTFRYRARSKVQAQRWRDMIKVRMSDMDQPYLHSFSYSYGIPPWFLTALKEIHRLRELTDGYGESYEEYFAAHSNGRVRTVTNLAGKGASEEVAETLVQVPGNFDFTGGPEKGEKDDGGESWTISFTYQFSYDKPMACYMCYPLMVHNQLLSDSFRANTPPDDPAKHVVGYAASIEALSHFQPDRQLENSTRLPGYAIPDIDEFIPGYLLPSTMRVITVMVEIDPANPPVLMNLQSLGYIELLPEIIDLLKIERAYLQQPYQSIFSLSLYRNSDLLDLTSLTLDTDLNVVATVPLSLRSCHHVRLGLVVDLRLLPVVAQNRIRRYGKALVAILKTLDPSLEEKGKLPAIQKGGFVTRDDLDIAIDEINRNVRNGYLHQHRHPFNTVQFLTIQGLHYADRPT